MLAVPGEGDFNSNIIYTFQVSFMHNVSTQVQGQGSDVNLCPNCQRSIGTELATDCGGCCLSVPRGCIGLDSAADARIT